MERAMRYLVVAFALGAAFLLLRAMTEQPPSRLFIENGFIGSGHYAVAKRQSPGEYSLYFGPVNGNPSLEIRSKGSLSSPFIADPSRFLVSERSQGKVPDFRLLEVRIVGSGVSCRRLVESKQYIGNPFVPEGSRSGEILFNSGDFHPEASGASVYSYRMTMLRDGKVSVFFGPTFLPIGRLAQIEDQRFLAVSHYLQFGGRPSVELGDSSDLVDIRLDGTMIEAAPVAFLRDRFETVTLISSLLETGIVFVRWGDFEDGRRSFVSTVRYSDEGTAETTQLPKGRDYGSVFAAPLPHGRYVARILSVDQDTRGSDGVFTISEFAKGELVNERTIKAESANVLDTATCSAALTKF